MPQTLVPDVIARDQELLIGGVMRESRLGAFTYALMGDEASCCYDYDLNDKAEMYSLVDVESNGGDQPIAVHFPYGCEETERFCRENGLSLTANVEGAQAEPFRLIGGVDRRDYIASRIRTLSNQSADEFCVLRLAEAPPDPRKPLLVIVHPGAAVANTFGVQDRSEVERVHGYMRGCQQGMTAEMAPLLDGAWDVVILHQGNSIEFVEREYRFNSDRAYSAAIERANLVGTALYGDHLDEAAAWIAKRLRAAKRPEILVTGAYGDENHGCAWTVCEALKKACVNVRLSEHSPLGEVEFGGAPAPAKRVAG